MSSFREISDSLLMYFLCFNSVILFILTMKALVQCILDGRGVRWITVTSANMGAAFSVLVLLVFLSSYSGKQDVFNTYYLPFEKKLFDLPWITVAVAEVIILGLQIYGMRDGFAYRMTHVTPGAVQLAVDALPEGIAVTAADGTVSLSNLRMNDLSRKLLGSTMSDANRFFAYLAEHGEKQGDGTLVRTADGEVWYVSRRDIRADDTKYVQVTAADVTERYRIIDELRAENEHLLDIQRRMKAVTELSGDMFVAQEEATARAALHNELGQVLLMGRHCLDHPESTDASMVYMTTRQMNSFLLGEAKEPYPEQTDALAESLTMARSIGVSVDIPADLPKEGSLAELLALAIRECAANTVKHAEGNHLMIEYTRTETTSAVTITNDGKPPRTPIDESGGLLSLRRSTEAAGGTMIVESTPAFALTICLPENAEKPS